MRSSSWSPLRMAKWRLFLVVLLPVVMLSYLIETGGVTPRTLGNYIINRTSGHGDAIEGAGRWLEKILKSSDRNFDPVFLNSGVWPSPVAARSGARSILVSSPPQLLEAIAKARPGEVITLLPGRYHFSGKSIPVSQPGTAAGEITVAASRPGTVFIEFDMLEGFLVSAPYWTFENLNIRGVCADHSVCEHAFHIVAGGAHFTARNNRIADFNAHFKINGIGNMMPDEGLIEGNTLMNTGVRKTANPVTPIDLVAASNWVIRRNLISDFIKGEGDRISYGAFAKGAGSANRFEQNIILCENRLRDFPGQRVGLSLGGGGTSPAACRDHRCITEQDGGVIQSNLIASCSDDGIYLNRAATSKVAHNTLLDTGGIVVRYAESSADVAGNLVDGNIRSRDGGVLRPTENSDTGLTALYLGMHPVRDLYTRTLAWRTEPPRRSAAQPGLPDLCGNKRADLPAYGAFEDYSVCLSGR